MDLKPSNIAELFDPAPLRYIDIRKGIPLRLSVESFFNFIFIINIHKDFGTDKKEKKRVYHMQVMLAWASKVLVITIYIPSLYLYHLFI